MCAQLSWNGGASWTTALSTTTLSTATTNYILGGATNTWGRTWTVGDVSNANFRVRIIDVASSTARDFSLDGVAVQVSYHKEGMGDRARMTGAGFEGYPALSVRLIRWTAGYFE